MIVTHEQLREIAREAGSFWEKQSGELFWADDLDAAADAAYASTKFGAHPIKALVHRLEDLSASGAGL